jgi:hypothetical protein
MNKQLSFLINGTLAFLLLHNANAETVGVFFDNTNAPIKFAAGDVKSALEKKQFTVEMLPLEALKKNYGNKKVVISTATHTIVSSALAEQGGKCETTLGEQAYALRTTEQPHKTYWALGGDVNGSMYSGFQIAENITFNSFEGTYNSEEKPTLLKRGIKLNLPLDATSGTYDTLNQVSDSAKQSIPHVWDMSFWSTWFDEMARHRYNAVSVWSNHHFTSMINMPDYPDVAIQNITGYDGYSKKMSIDEKIAFWKNVMAYAHSRGFDFYLINWNLFTYGATGKYGITDEKDGVTNPATIEYMRKCMTQLLETYPDLDGFGITQGEHMSKNKQDEASFLGKTYGKGMAEYAKKHPERKLRFIHRWHMADFSDMKKNFAELMQLPDVTFDMSYKYSKAHMYATVAPAWMNEKEQKALRENNLKSWFTVRNDSYYFLHWGDPEFARAYIKLIPGQGDWFRGMLLGGDGFIPTRVFYSKNSVSQGTMEVERRWYMNMLWGRLSYNPDTADSVFINSIKEHFPTVSSTDLFSAWSKASRGLPKATELVHGDFKLDFEWWPEACQSYKGFIKLEAFANCEPGKGSKLCKANGKKTSYELADEIEKDARAALELITPMKADSNTDLGITVNQIKSMSYLTLYYSEKIRGATHLKANNREKARDSMGLAYHWWIQYSTLMDSMFTGMVMQRTEELDNWHMHDASVLEEFTNLGGKNLPSGR